MSIEAIRAKLLPKFVATAKSRVAKAHAAIDENNASRVREELHAITGDAGMIGQPEIADLARDASVHARAWDAGDGAEKSACRTALDALTARLDALAARG